MVEKPSGGAKYVKGPPLTSGRMPACVHGSHVMTMSVATIAVFVLGATAFGGYASYLDYEIEFQGYIRYCAPEFRARCDALRDTEDRGGEWCRKCFRDFWPWMSSFEDRGYSPEDAEAALWWKIFWVRFNLPVTVMDVAVAALALLVVFVGFLIVTTLSKTETLRNRVSSAHKLD